MRSRKLAILVVALLTICWCALETVHAENKMGYQLLSQQDAMQLPHSGGSLGMDIARAQQITDADMTFDIIRIKSVRHDSPAERAGLNAGDQIIAVDGRVFANLAAFAGYVGSVRPGTKATIDYMPANGGPAQAQRVAVTVGAANGKAQPPSSTGMSTETKVAIGVGAAALLGCYELGCFSRRPSAQPNPATSR